LEALI